MTANVYLKWSPSDVEFLASNYRSMTAREIADRLGRGEDSVVHKLKKLGLRKRSNPGRCKPTEANPPTPAEIAARAAEIRKGWSAARESSYLDCDPVPGPSRLKSREMGGLSMVRRAARHKSRAC